MSESKGSRFLEGFFIGGLFGLALGLLIAPKAGDELRQEMNEKIKEVYGKINCALRESRDAIEIAIAQGKSTAEATRREVVEAFDQAREKLESTEQ